MMAYLARSGDPERERAIAVCITSCVPRSELPEKDCGLFLVEKLAEILRNSTGLYRVEIDLHADKLFTLYTYAEPLEDKEGDNH